ncbi:MAG: dihydroorotate dehydrogenase electron transfer subunit, partial [Oscillospiraceae bacterium]|nr:dihydroorotate dehydrogenase electron transfer subunit [Oscillospiraceae bacterium]
MKSGADVILCTDDGTAGRKGFVTQALSEVLEKETPDMVYACGHMPMLRGVAKMCLDKGIRTQVSLEERMGCGLGGCLVCVCRTQKNDEEVYSHVCKDGPVFEAEEVLF